MSRTATHIIANRRSMLQRQSEIRLFDDRIEQWRDDRLERRIGLDEITRVRLTVEPAGQSASQIVCRVTAKGREIGFSSQRLTKANGFDQQIEAFKPMLTGLHNALTVRKDAIEFIEGPSLALLLGLFLAGGVMMIAGLAFSAYMFGIAANAMLGFAGLPFVLIGGSIAWVFRPKKPKIYDPGELVARFTA